MTESWALLPKGVDGFREHFGESADAEIAKRVEAARTGILATLAAIKELAEAGGWAAGPPGSASESRYRPVTPRSVLALTPRKNPAATSKFRAQQTHINGEPIS